MKKLRILCIVSLLAVLLASCAGPDGTEPSESSTDTTAETVEAADTVDTVDTVDIADTVDTADTVDEVTVAPDAETQPEDETESETIAETSAGTTSSTTPAPWEGEYTSEVQPELILDNTVYNADSDPIIAWTVVAAEPGVGLSTTIDGWLYRMEGDEKVYVGCASQEISILEAPPSPEEYATFRTSWDIHHFLLLEQLPPYELTPGEYVLEYRNGGQEAMASATFTVTETLTCPHDVSLD